MEKIKGFFKKGNYTVQKLILSIIFSLLVSSIFVLSRPVVIYDRIIIFSGVLEFICLHFIYKLNELYDFIYQKRYWIALAFMVFVLLFQYSGSSIGTYSVVIQGEYQERYFTPVLGRFRSIRSDEWSVNSPIHLSQCFSPNAFAYYNNRLRGTLTDMFIISSPPIMDISILGRIFNIGYLVFGASRGLSFLWYGKLTFLVLVAFEFCMLLTNKKKLASLAGMIAIVFSAATQWWFTTSVDILMWGMFAILLWDKFLLTKKLKIKILCAFGLFISGISYIFILYPAWLVSYGYVYFALAIWIFLKNKKEYKINLRDIVIFFITLISMGLVLFRFYNHSIEGFSIMMNTDYPGERFELGGGGGKAVFSYVYSLLFPYIEIGNPCEASGMISFFPMPILIALLYIIRNYKKKDLQKIDFLIPMISISLLLMLWTFRENSQLFAKLTFLYMVPPTRSSVPLGFSQLLILIYLLGNLNQEDVIVKNKKIKICLTAILSIFVMYYALKYDNDMAMTGIRIYICGLISLFAIYQIWNINLEENKKNLIILLIIIGIITGATVNPIQKGISVITSKPISQQIQKLSNEDEDKNLWLVDNTAFFVPNYFLANGARVINSTNVYPNFDLFETVLGEKSKEEEVRKIYNRYAHLNIEISTENKVELLFEDSIKLYLTTEKLKDLGVHYVASTRQLEEFDTSEINFQEVYSEYGLYIYELEY